MSGFGPLGKMLILLGVFIILIGILLVIGEKIPWIGRLPGDIIIRKKNFTFYFPIVTSILISILLTLLFALFRKQSLGQKRLDKGFWSLYFPNMKIIDASMIELSEAQEKQAEKMVCIYLLSITKPFKDFQTLPEVSIWNYLKIFRRKLGSLLKC